jgi:adenine-specific DNA-methyltransferase
LPHYLHFSKQPDNNPSNVAVEHEYLLIFSKNKDALQSVWKSGDSAAKDELERIGEQIVSKYDSVTSMQEAYTKWFRENKQFLGELDRYKYIDEGGVYTGSQSVHNPGKEGYRYDVIHPKINKPCKQPLMGYRFPEDTMNSLLQDGKILFGDDEDKIIELKVYAKDYQSKLSSFINLDGRTGAYDLKEVFPESKQIFKNPKPVSLVKYILSFIVQENEMVMDFFAGSGTTAHAIQHLNLEDNGGRKYALVQVPEYTDEKTEAYKSGYKTISSLCIERAKRVGEAIKTEHPDAQIDTGFRVYKLTDSHFPENLFTSDPQKSEADNLATLEAHIKAASERTLFPADNLANIITEISLKNGYGLFFTLEQLTTDFPQNTVYRLSGNDKSTLLCLDEGIHEDTVDTLVANFSDGQLIISKHGLDTAKKWTLQNSFKDNMQVV